MYNRSTSPGSCVALANEPIKTTATVVGASHARKIKRFTHAAASELGQRVSPISHCRACVLVRGRRDLPCKQRLHGANIRVKRPPKLSRIQVGSSDIAVGFSFSGVV